MVRKVRIGESLVPAYRNKTPIEETVRKSLAEVYGDKMSKKLNATEGRDDVSAFYSLMPFTHNARIHVRQIRSH